MRKSWKLLLSSMSNFYQWLWKIHFPSHCLFFERAVEFTIYLYYNKNVDSKPVRRRFSIIKVFLKNFAKLTEIYISRRLFSHEVEGCRLKRDSGTGAFLFFKNDYVVVHVWTAASDTLEYLLPRDIFCKVHIEEMHSFVQHFGIDWF